MEEKSLTIRREGNFLFNVNIQYCLLTAFVMVFVEAFGFIFQRVSAEAFVDF